MAGNGTYSLLEIGRGDWAKLIEFKEVLLQKEKERQEKIFESDCSLHMRDVLKEKRPLKSKFIFDE